MHVCENTLNEAAEKLTKMPSEWTLSDFPLMAMEYSDLQRLRHHLTRLGVTDIANVDDVYPCSVLRFGAYRDSIACLSSYVRRRRSRRTVLLIERSELVGFTSYESRYNTIRDRPFNT